MRLPLTTKTDSRDGVSDKDARLTNALVEDGKVVARPGIQLYRDLTTAATGKGLVEFNGKLIAAAGQAIYTEVDQATYTPVRYNSTMDGTNKVLFHKGKFIALYGSSTSIYESTDGAAWDEIGTLPVTTVKALAASDKTICIVYETAAGKSSTKTSSDGGRSWVTSEDCFSTSIAMDFAKAHFDGEFFIVSLYVEDPEATTIWFSKDGVRWTKGTSTFVFIGQFATGNGVTVAIDDNNGPSQYTTNHGKTWANCSGLGATQNPISIAFGDGLFLASSQASGSPAPTGKFPVYASKDGITWKYVSFTDESAPNGGLVYTGAGFFFSTTTNHHWGNGLSQWTKTAASESMDSMDAIAVGNSLVVQLEGNAFSMSGSFVMEVDNLSSVGTVAGDFFDFVESAT